MTAVYLLVSFAFLSVVPVERIVSNTAFVAQFGEALFGAAGSRVLSACVLLSVLGGLAALTMAVPRVYYAMARDGQFFSVFGKLHARFETPANAVLLHTVLALIVLSFGAFDRHPCLHHLFCDLFPRALRRYAFPFPKADRAVVVSCRAHLLHLRMHPHRPHDPHA